MSDLTKKEWENFSCCSLRHILEFFTYIILNLALSKTVWSSERLYLYQSVQWPSLWAFELMSLWWSELCHREQYISVFLAKPTTSSGSSLFQSGESGIKLLTIQQFKLQNENVCYINCIKLDTSWQSNSQGLSPDWFISLPCPQWIYLLGCFKYTTAVLSGSKKWNKNINEPPLGYIFGKYFQLFRGRILCS